MQTKMKKKRERKKDEKRSPPARAKFWLLMPSERLNFFRVRDDR